MLSIIIAVSKNGVIGCNNTLVWNLKDDLKRFKDITSYHTIIMGRKTFEALPYVLPNRKHIVVTKNPNYKFEHNDVIIKHNLKEVLEQYKSSDTEYFVIGGGEIYKQALPFVNKIYLTNILQDFDGDTFFKFNESDFNITYKSNKIINNNIAFEYINFERQLPS